MKRLLGLAVAVVILIGAASVYADGGCCAAGKAKSAACGDMFGKLKLTDDQKAKVTALKDECLKATSTSERREMMTKGMQSILAPEQFAQWKSACDKGMKSGGCTSMKSSECPFMKSAQKN